MVDTYGEKERTSLRRIKMLDYIKRFLIAGIMAVCVGLLFWGGKHSQASMIHSDKETPSWIWPADGIISDTFGTRQGKHKGVDIAGNLNTPVLSVDNGVVEKSYYSTTYGNVIFIHHPNHFVTVYAHLNARLAGEGQLVKQGEIIGKMGRSGQATGVHLHFEAHQTKWTYDKRFAFDPDGVLGNKGLGEVVQAGAGQRREIEASSHIQPQTPNHLYETKETALRYIVRRGDTLSSISKKLNLPIEELKRMNRLSSDYIKPKQVLLFHKAN